MSQVKGQQCPFVGPMWYLTALLCIQDHPKTQQWIPGFLPQNYLVLPDGNKNMQQKESPDRKDVKTDLLKIRSKGLWPLSSSDTTATEVGMTLESWPGEEQCVMQHRRDHGLSSRPLYIYVSLCPAASVPLAVKQENLAQGSKRGAHLQLIFG